MSSRTKAFACVCVAKSASAEAQPSLQLQRQLRRLLRLRLHRRLPHCVSPAHPGAQAKRRLEDQDLHIIPSPIVGTFYRSPSPTADPFVKIGSNVEPETVVCIIEAMKLMNEIQAETTGEVVKIYVENGQPVEYGQPLFGIKKLSPKSKVQSQHKQKTL